MTCKSLVSKTISINVSILLILQQSIIAGEIVSDVSVNSSFQATVEKAPNGIPVVNIVKPNETGLSHNKFSDYNVNKEGAILNNSNQREVNTQLAGYIYGNKNLAGGNTASTILNEVTSRNKTELKGFTEVAGDKANVMVANQNGIYINGAGFINTQKATITTGNINVVNNQIDNYQVRDGEIQVDGDGLNTSNVSKTEIYSKVVKLNAQIHANDLDVVTGKNDISKDGSVKKIDEIDNQKPEVSLDSSSLGGIYANKISLIGTQDGVGVNLPIEISAQDDFKLSADGKITLDKVVSNKNVEIKSNSNDINSNVIYANSINIEAKNEINNKDTIASKTDLNLKATTIVNENIIASGVNEDLSESVKGNMNIVSDNLENKKTLLAKDNLTINSKNIKNSNNAVNKATNINIKSDNLELKAGQIIAKENLNVVNANLVDMEDTNVQANKIDIASNELVLSNQKDKIDDYDSRLISNTIVNINTNKLKNVNGYIGANGNVIINSQNVDNTSGVVVSNNDLVINENKPNVGLFLNTNGLLQSLNSNVLINAYNIKGMNSQISAKKYINIFSNSLDGTLIAIADQNNLSINTLGDINLVSSYLSAQNGLVDLNSNQNNITLTNTAAIGNNVNLKANSITTNGEIKSNINDNMLYSLNDININANTYNATNTTLQANNDVNVIASNINLDNSKIQTVVDINDSYENGYKQGNINLINTNLNILNNSKLTSKDINIKDVNNTKSQNVIINNSTLDVNNDINLKSKNLTLDKSSLIALNNVNAENSGDIIIQDEVKIEASNDLVLNTNNLSIFSDNSQLVANNNLNLNVLDKFGNRGTLKSKNTSLNTNYLLNYGFILALNNLTINANDVDNMAGIAVVDLNDEQSKNSILNVNVNNLSNYNTIYVNGDINLNVKNQLLNKTDNSVVNIGTDKATIYAVNNLNIGNENLGLRTNSIVNDKSIIQTKEGDINIFANSLENLASELKVYGEYVENSEGKFIIGGKRIDNQTYRIDKGTNTYDDYTVYTDIMTHEKPEIAQILSGKDIYFNTNSISNNYSLISANNDIYFESDVLSNKVINILQLVTTEKKIYTEEEYCGGWSFGIFGAKWCSDWDQRPAYRKTETNYDTEIIDTISSTIEAGGIFKGTFGDLINGSEHVNVEFKTYNPNSKLTNTATDLSNNLKNTQTTSTNDKSISSDTDIKVTIDYSIKADPNDKIQEALRKKFNTDGYVKIESQGNLDIKLDDAKKVINTIVLNPIDETYKLPTNKYGLFTTVDPNKNLNYLVESNPLYTNLSSFTGSQYFLDKMNYQGDRITKRLGDAAYETKLITDSIVKQTGQRFLGNYTSENAQFVALMDSAINLSGVLGLEIGKALTIEQLASLTEDIVWMEEKVVAGQKVLAPVVYLAKDYEYLKGATITAGKGMDLTVKNGVVNNGTIKSGDYLSLNSKTITNNQGVILANGMASLISDGDIVNKNGGLIKGGEVQIASLNGNIINQTFAQTSKLQNGNNDFTYTLLGEQSKIESTNGNLILQAKNNIDNIGANLTASKTLSLNAQNGDVNFKTLSLETGHNINYSGGFDKALDIEHLAATASGGENVIMKSGNNINLESAKINAVNQINLNAQNDVNITAVNDVHYKDVQTTSKGFLSKKTQRDMTYKEEVQSAQLNANDIVINGGNDVNLEASKLYAQNNLLVNAQNGDLNILAKEYREGELHSTSKSSFGGLSKSLDVSSKDSLKLNSAELQTKGDNIILTSGNDINILASNINSGKLLLADAKNNLNILSDEEILKQEEIHKKTSFSPSISGKMLVYAQEKTTSDKNSTIKQVSSNLSGNEVLLQAENEMNIIGSNVVGNDVVLKANDINILSATQSASNEHSESTKKIGVEVTLNSKEASIFAGGITNKDEINKGNTTQKASNILGDNVTLISKDSTNVLASNILANNDLMIAGGKNINILSGEVTDYKDEIHTYLKAGISLGVKQNVTDGAKNVTNTIKNAATSSNAINAVSGTLKSIDGVSNTLSTPVSAGLNAVAIINKSTSSTTNQGVQSSNIYAGNNATFDAEDVNIKGSNVYVKNDFDIYAKNLNIEAAKETSNSKTTDKNMDLTVGLYGTNMGQVDVSVSQAKQTSDKTNYVNSNIQAGSLNLNVSNDVKIEGANIKAKDVMANVGNNLTIASLQNNSSSKGNSQNLSIGTSGSGSLSVGVGENESQRDWVDNQTTFVGTNSMNVNVGGTTTIKGAVLANADYVDGKLVDKNNLKLNTTNLISENIYDKNNSNSYNVSLGVSKTEKQTQRKMELGLSDSSKEQINYATIGNGEIKTNSDITNLNRDVNKSQVVTKDENSNLNIYLSNTSVEKALNPNETVAKWKQDFKDMGLNVRNEILANLPDSKSQGFAGVVGGLLDTAEYFPVGLFPTVANQGGYVTQIATQLSGDNRTGVVVKDKNVLVKAGVTENDIEEVTLVKTKDGIKRAEDVKSTDKILDTAIVYETDPNKTIIISENQASIDKEKSLSDYNSMKIYLTQEDVKNSGINHLFTNGMYNPFDTAAYNQQTQQSNTNAILNYNQQHGIVGDLMESAQDALVVDGMGLMNSVNATSSNKYVSYLGTGGARQTGDLINTMAIVTNGNLTVGAHSQGTLMTQVGMQNNIDSLKTIVQDNPNSKLLVGYAGSPVNHNTGETLLSTIYGGEKGIEKHFGKDITEISNVFRSNVSPQDFVGSFLGGQSAGINSSEKLGLNMWSSLLSIPMLFGVGGDSSHSYYPCVIGCGNENYTPNIKNYYTPNAIDGEKEHSRIEYYKNNFTNEKGQITINMDLLPNSIQQNKQIVLDTTKE